MINVEQKMGRLQSKEERIRRPNAGDIPPMPATTVAPSDEPREAPVPGTLPPEREEDDAMGEELPEENGVQDLADDEDDDDELPSYRQGAFGPEAESDDSDREETTALAGKRQRTACLSRLPQQWLGHLESEEPWLSSLTNLCQAKLHRWQGHPTRTRARFRRCSVSPSHPCRRRRYSKTSAVARNSRCRTSRGRTRAC